MVAGSNPTARTTNFKGSSKEGPFYSSKVRLVSRGSHESGFPASTFVPLFPAIIREILYDEKPKPLKARGNYPVSKRSVRLVFGSLNRDRSLRKYEAASCDDCVV